MRFYTFARWICKCFLKIAYRVEISGVEHLPKQGGFIVACNHVTLLDPILIALKVPYQLKFMAKAELFRFPLGGIIKALGAFAVHRGTGDTAALNTAVEIVNRGEVLALFPEGTRSKTGALLRFKSGVSVIAAQTGADVLPVSIRFEGKPRFRAKIHVRYGPIIEHSMLFADADAQTTLRPAQIKQATTLIKARVAQLFDAE